MDQLDQVCLFPLFSYFIFSTMRKEASFILRLLSRLRNKQEMCILTTMVVDVPWRRSAEFPGFVGFEGSGSPETSGTTYNFSSTQNPQSGFRSAQIIFPGGNIGNPTQMYAYFNQQHVRLCPKSYYIFTAVGSQLLYRHLTYNNSVNLRRCRSWDVMSSIYVFRAIRLPRTTTNFCELP